MDGLQVTVTNYSDIPWTRNNWHVGAGSTDETNWTDEVTQIPATTLQAHDGQTSAAANSEHMAIIVQDALWMIVGYGSPVGNFAVKLQQYFHMFGIGPQNGWAYWDDTKKAWSDTTTDTSPRTWAFGKYEVLATPVLSSSGGSVEIIVRAKSST